MEDKEDLWRFGVVERLRDEVACGLTAIWKWRCGDFQVHEVTPEGKVIHLEDVRDRRSVALEVQGKRDLDSGTGVVSEDYKFTEDELTELCTNGCLTEDDVQTLQEFIRSIARSSTKRTANPQPESQTHTALNSLITDDNPPHCILLGDKVKFSTTVGPEADSKIISKGLRKAVHEAIRRVCPYLSSQAIDISKVNQTYMMPTKTSDATMSSDSASVQGSSLAGVLITRSGVDAVRVYFPSIVDLNDDCNKVHLTKLLDDGPQTQVVAVFPKQLCLRKLILAHSGIRRAGAGRGATAPKAMAGRGRGRGRGRDKRTRSRVEDKADDSDGNLLLESQVCTGEATAESKHEKSTLCGLGKEFKPAVYDRWPKDRPPFLYFHMWKSDIDTAAAVDMIANCIGCQPRVLSVAGTKDKRAVTVQAVTASKVSMEQMTRAILNRYWNNRVKVSNFAYRSSRLALGELKGNLFRITLRAIPKDQLSLVDSLCTDLATKGFLNYFGRQRFGSHSVPTHVVGVAMLMSDWQSAVRLILGDTELLSQFGWTLPVSSTDKDGTDAKSMNSEVPLEEVSGGECHDDSVVDESCGLSTDNNYAEGMVSEDQCNSPSTQDRSVQGLEDQKVVVDRAATADVEIQSTTTGVEYKMDASNGSGGEAAQLAVNRKRNPNDGINNAEVNAKKAKHEHDPVQQYRAHKRACRTELTKACLSFLKMGNAAEALSRLPRQWHLERDLLTSLCEQPHDWLRALNKLPSNNASLYIHAAQSLVWNLVASWRKRRYRPIVVVKGDLVELEATHPLFNDSTHLEVVADPTALHRGRKTDDTTAPQSKLYCKNVFRVISDEAALSLPASAIVHPLPGEAVVYPEHLKELYNKACSLIALELDAFESKNRHGMCSVAGSYRRLLVVPELFQWKVHSEVTGMNCPLAASDLDRLLGHDVANEDAPPPSWSEVVKIGSSGENTKIKAVVVQQQDKEKVKAAGAHATQQEKDKIKVVGEYDVVKAGAAVISCQLPKSSYFTMALRELLSDDCKVCL